jgi:outer membrane protein
MHNFDDLRYNRSIMKRLTIIFVLSVLTSTALFAQKFGYVDTDYVLKHMPEFTEAQGELNRLASSWQEEIEAKYEAIRLLEESFQAEKILLTQEMRQRREQEIAQKRDEAKMMQKQKFGVEGELFQKREELIKPVQEKIYEAIQDVAGSRGYMVIFDKSNNSNMLYTNPKYDLSDDVIKKMGYKPGEIVEEEKEDQGNGGSDARESKGGTDRGTSPASRGGSNVRRK